MAPWRNRKSRTTRLASAVTLSTPPSVIAISRAASSRATQALLDDLAVLVGRHESSGSHRSWTKIVSHCRPSGCSRRMCTAPAGRASRARSGAMPASSQASLAPASRPRPRRPRCRRRPGCRACRGRSPCAGLRRANHMRSRIRAPDDAVDVDRPGMHAEVARRRALEQEPRRGAEVGSDRVEFVAPRGQRAFRGQRGGHVGHGCAARRRACRAREETRRTRCSRRRRRRNGRGAPPGRRRSSRRRRRRYTTAVASRRWRQCPRQVAPGCDPMCPCQSPG